MSEEGQTIGHEKWEEGVEMRQRFCIFLEMKHTKISMALDPKQDTMCGEIHDELNYSQLLVPLILLPRLTWVARCSASEP